MIKSRMLTSYVIPVRPDDNKFAATIRYLTRAEDDGRPLMNVIRLTENQVRCTLKVSEFITLANPTIDLFLIAIGEHKYEHKYSVMDDGRDRKMSVDNELIAKLGTDSQKIHITAQETNKK